MPERSAPASSPWRVEIAPGSAAALAGSGLEDAPERALDRATPIGANEGRDVRRLDDPTGAKRPLYLKWFAPARARLAAEEAAHLEALAARAPSSLAVPPLLARARRSDGAALLVLGELSGRPFDAWIAGAPADARRRASRALGEALAVLHGRGATHGQLFAWHLLVADEASFGLLDLSAARVRARGATRRERAADLAALFATVGRRSWSLAERARLLAAYEPEPSRRRELVPAIRRERLRLLRRARVPRDWLHREWRTPTQRLLVAEACAAAPSTPDPASVASVDAWLAPAGATLVRTRDGRSNLRWRAPAGEPGATWFGKRFERAPWRGRAFAFREFVTLRALAAIGLPVPAIVAVGRREGGASIVWTRGVAPGTSLRDELPRLARGGAGARERRRLLTEAARLARRLHAAGFVHRDLYLDHFLIDDSTGAARLVVIDATRVAAFARLPERARTRDLAALEFSARAAGASRSERWRALLVYARGDRALARSLALRARRKAAAIERRERRRGAAAGA